jgi:thiosulfate reductase cytochrome b subunit
MAMAPAKTKPIRILVRRHGRIVRLTHWVNAFSLLFLLLSGLQIFNAHPALYWGQQSQFSDPWFAAGAPDRAGQLRGVTMVDGRMFDTTGFLGASRERGVLVPRGFPAWLTIPSERYLALGRRWHFFFAWVFALNGALYAATAVLSGHFARDLAPRRDQLRPGHVLHEIWTHMRLKFPKDEAARRYNVLQKGAYLGVGFVLLPLMVLAGMAMSPSLDADFPFLTMIFGGRQSARSIHFIVAWLIVLFFVVHVAMVVLSGLWNNLRSMVTGRYAIEVEPASPPAPVADAP